MNSVTLYKKLGKKYIPVSESMEFDSFPMGCHLVVVYPGRIARRFNIISDNISLAAAAIKIEDKLVDIISSACGARLRKKELTEEQLKAWNKLNKAMGGMTLIEYPSITEIAQKILKEIIEQGEH